MRAILWVRTSTNHQEVESSKEELISFAAEYGYTDYIIIGTKGASAIKADEKYRKEFDELYQQLYTGEYNCVFAWELSRIGRIEEYVIGLKNYLIKNKIQLRIKKPSLYLLEDDGSVNSGMELAISLLLTLAKQEMTIKGERMLRGKRYAQRDGKFSGAPCLRYGYTMDENGYIIEDPITGKYVREMFDMYLERNMSTTAIYKDFNQRGILRDYADITAGTNRVLRILKSKVYAGHPDRGNQYPAIVTDEMVKRATEKASIAKTKPKTTTKNVYYCKGAIFCECGYRMIPVRNNVVYSCTKHGHKNAVNVNVLDFIGWEMAKVYKPYALKHQNQETLEEYERMSKNEMSLMEQMMGKKVLVNRKIEKANELYIDGHITKKRLEEKLQELSVEQRKLDEGIVNHLNRFEASERLKKGILNDSFDVSTIEDDEMRRKYILETIRLKVSRIDDERGHYRIEVENLVMSPRKDWFDYLLKGHFITLRHHINDSGSISDENWTDYWPVRFKRL